MAKALFFLRNQHGQPSGKREPPFAFSAARRQLRRFRQLQLEIQIYPCYTRSDKNKPALAICKDVKIAMKRYIALLRGINRSGKNKISMAELKSYFAELGYADVFTHLNSGNVIFSVNEGDELILADRIKTMIQERFDLEIPVFVILQETLKDLLKKAPVWWGTNDKQIYDNLIFVLPSAAAERIAEKIGEPTEGLEQIYIYENVIFWSFDRKKYVKANWWKKTASAGIGEMMTIRTANTLKKIAIM